MADLVLLDALVSVPLDEDVRVKVETADERYDKDEDDETICISFFMGEKDEEDEVCFAIDRANVGRWMNLFNDAQAGLIHAAEQLHERFDGCDRHKEPST